jgi:hypothetical protein
VSRRLRVSCEAKVGTRVGEDELKLPLDEVKALESSWDDTPMPRPKPKDLRDTGETEFDFRMPGGPSRLIDQIADELGPGERRNSLRHPPAPKAPPPPPPPTPPIGLNSPAGLPPPRMVAPLPPAPPPGWASRVAPAAPPPAQPIAEEATAPAPLLDGLELPPPPAKLHLGPPAPPAPTHFRPVTTPAPAPTPPSYRLGPPPPPPGPTPPPPPSMPPELTPIPGPGPWSASGPPTPGLGLEGLVIGPPMSSPAPAMGARPLTVPGLSPIPAPPSAPPPNRPTPPIALESIGLAELKMPDRPLAPPIAPDRPTVLIDGQAAALDHAIASSFTGGPERGSAPRAPTAPPPAPPPTPAFGVPAEGLDEQQMARIILGTPSPNATPVELKRIDLAADLRDLVPAPARIGTQRPLPMPSAPPLHRSAPPVPPLPMPGANATWWRPFVLGVGVASLLWFLLRWLS